jgi:hypothetical protein
VVLTNSAGPLFGPPGGSALFDDILPAVLELLDVPGLPPAERSGSGRPAATFAGGYGPLTVEATGDDALLVHAAAFGEPAPIPHHRVGGDTFEVDTEAPGAVPIAFDAGLLYLGPMAFPSVDAPV